MQPTREYAPARQRNTSEPRRWEGEVSFSVEGDYFEVCTCDVSCNCVWLGTATQDTCDVLLAWHVTNGNKDGVDLSGLNAVMAVHSPKRMTDGG